MQQIRAATAADLPRISKLLGRGIPSAGLAEGTLVSNLRYVLAMHADIDHSIVTEIVMNEGRFGSVRLLTFVSSYDPDGLASRMLRNAETLCTSWGCSLRDVCRSHANELARSAT